MDTRYSETAVGCLKQLDSISKNNKTICWGIGVGFAIIFSWFLTGIRLDLLKNVVYYADMAFIILLGRSAIEYTKYEIKLCKQAKNVEFHDFEIKDYFQRSSFSFFGYYIPFLGSLFIVVLEGIFGGISATLAGFITAALIGCHVYLVTLKNSVRKNLRNNGNSI